MSEANNEENKIFIICPGGLVTGGAELLHQLVDRLRKIGKSAYVSYVPANGSFSLPEAYRKYDAPQSSVEDLAGNLVVFPEICTRHSRRIKHAECAIWWLSVDNYFRFPQNHRAKNPLTHIKANRFYDPLRYLGSMIRNRSFQSMSALRHFTQSKYAQVFLSGKGIASIMLTDYLGSDHTDAKSGYDNKKDIVVFNPKKGIEITSRLIEALPGYQFVPIQDLTALGVAELLRSAKVYIDFGNHPGKDRPPREAAMAGCCVVVGGDGASADGLDYLIPSYYRVDPASNGFVQAFQVLIDRIFAEYDVLTLDFDAWRTAIRREKQDFEAQVSSIFDRY